MVWLAYWVVLGASYGASIFALVKGDRAVRYGALLRVGVLSSGLGIQFILGKLPIPMSVWLPIYELCATTIMASGFLFLAIRYGSPWLAAAMVIQGFDFYADRVFLDSDVQDRLAYGIQENLITTGVALALFLGSLSAIRLRKRRRDEEALRQQKAEARQARIASLLSQDIGLYAA